MSPKQIVVTLSLALGLGAPAWAAGSNLPANEADAERTARAVYQVLLGELALQRGAVPLSVDAWADLAEATRDPKALARATEVAGFAGQHERALELARLWLEVEPDSAKARQAQAALLIQLRRFADLAPRLAALLAQDRDNLPVNLLHLNRMLGRVEDKAAVLALVAQLTRPYDGLPEAHFALAQAALSAGDEARALSEAEKALQLRPDWEAAALARAQMQARKSPTEAIAGLQAHLKRTPDAREVRLTLARLLVSEKRLDEARRQYEQLLAAHPDDPGIIYPVAILALQHGDMQTGRSQLERLLATNFPDKSAVHFLLGQIAQEGQRKEDALAHFLKVSAGEHHVQARVRAAQLLIEQGKPDNARLLLQETRGATPPERAQLQLTQAQLLREAGRHAEAYAILEGALAGQPDNLELLYDAALSAERIGRHDRLESHLQHLLRLQPAHAHALNALGYSWAERNIRLPEAEKLIARALALAPEDPFIMDSLGWVQYRQGRLAEALQTLEKAHAIKADPEISAHLGEVLWQLERRDEALRIWRTAAGQHPGNAALTATLHKFAP